ncbi:MAG: hypothetical protein GX585_06000 [Clostridiales bacterium]|nr:hypothetical protein [Clostridiales bacterium]
MCKFCNAIMRDGVPMPERVLSDFQLGDYGLSVYLDGETLEIATVEIGEEDGYDPFFDNISIPISYCPICGRKLEKI